MRALVVMFALLVMFAHPRCPCTRASVGELERLLAEAPARCSAKVIFLQPTGMDDEWVESDLWHTASRIPGVTVHRDRSGIEARWFHAETSGQTLLYDRGGRLIFQGGITISRGHAGDNPGRSALLARLRDRTASLAKTPVFGCALFSANDRNGAQE